MTQCIIQARLLLPTDGIHMFQEIVEKGILYTCELSLLINSLHNINDNGAMKAYVSEYTSNKLAYLSLPRKLLHFLKKVYSPQRL